MGRHSRCRVALVTLAVAVLCGSPSSVLAQPNPDLNHFQCHELKTFPRFDRLEDLQLDDQFGPGVIDVRKRKRLCNPADKNGEDPTAPTDPDHLVGYQIKQTDPKLPRFRDVGVVNQFGAVVVELKRPQLLLVPSAKDPAVPPAPLVAPVVDHYKCYRVRGGKLDIADVDLIDQVGAFEAGPRHRRSLCIAAEKNGEPILEPDSHLMCYRIKTVPRKPNSIPTFFIDNQFEAAEVTVSGPRDVCVPSTVIPCCGPNDRCIDVDGSASPDRGLPLAVDVAVGDALTTWPTGVDPDGHVLQVFDPDLDGFWSTKKNGEDLHIEGASAACPTGIANSQYDAGADCVVLDVNGSLADGQPATCDLETGVGCAAGITGSVKFFDANLDGFWDDGEDIILDVNANGICD